MASADYEFTTNAEIEAFIPGDAMMEITGFVDATDGIRAVQTYQKWIYKCVLNNDAGSRMRIVFWGDDAINFSEKIHLNEILEITGGTIGLANRRFSLPNEKICANEFYVQTFSKVTFYGCYKNAVVDEEVMYTKTTVADILSVDGPVYIDAYLKTEFAMVKRGNNASYGSGVVCDGEYRLCVQIASFAPNQQLEKGVHLQLKGQMDRSLPGSAFFKVKDMKNVMIIEGSQKISSEHLKKAILGPKTKEETLKRKDSENKETQVEKKVKTD